MLRLAFLALLLAVPAAAAAQDGVDPLVARAVASYRAARDRDSASRIRVRDARGEGRTLILDVELLPGASTMLEPANVLPIFSGSICADAEAARFFGEGRAMRVNLVREGRRLGSATTDRCPGAIGQGLSAATFAGVLQSFVGTVDRGVRITAVRAEGATLTLSLDVLPGTDITAEAAAGNFIRGFCSRSDTDSIFFDRGLTLRIETTLSGRSPPTAQSLARCPAR